MTERLITVRSKPIPLEVEGGQTGALGDFPRSRPGTRVADVAICTKQGMNIRVRSADMMVPDSECYFYVRLQHSWCRSDGAKDFDEIITDGEKFFYIAFRSLGKTRMRWTEDMKQTVIHAIQEFTSELSELLP